MKQIVVPFGRAIGMEGSTLLPAVLKKGCVDVLVILENIEFVILFHRWAPFCCPGAALSMVKILSGPSGYIKMITHYIKKVHIFHFGI